MTAPISTDAHFQAWMAAPEERRAAAHAALIGAGGAQECAGRLLTISSAAKMMGTSRCFVYRAIARGALQVTIPFSGANPRILERELHQFADRRETR